ncbi:hypothetical protein OM076_18585 [Solirubrobacter ginsenosidimutans]|uniref:Uncharacterized protein n=1 Tax=Solirubrobacter ginsenosidimutans TaxID=490573 RepID=A0A9X3S0Q0_9ACTN|nr:hypothetical protein [Solirubrobacter ginsenosidimutans]MDA0162285.1 hypothetical protein [Solirubrobacter ginsenosidimutans]
MSLYAAVGETTTFRWLPKEIDLGFAGTSALLTTTLALACVWLPRLLWFLWRAQRGATSLPNVRFDTLAVLSSGAAALGAAVGLAFTISGALMP